MNELIYSMEAARNLIGCLLNNPKVLLTNKYDISRDDFSPSLIHYRLVAVIENLVANGSGDISSMDVEQFISGYEEVVELFKDNNTLGFIDTIKELVRVDNIELYANKVKKLTALRDYRDNGFDISELFDERKDIEQEMNNIDKVKIDDIVSYFEMKEVSLKRRYNKKDSSTSYTPEVDRLRSIIKSFKENPLQGACLQSPYLTTIMNGALRGHLMTRSGNSGSGKSTISSADICELCATYLYNKEEGVWEENYNRQGGGLVIHTESNTELEVIPMYLSYISKVPRDRIIKGKMTEEEEELIDYAIQVLEDSQIYYIYDAKFTESSIKEAIKEYVDKYGIFAVFMDYLQLNSYFNVKMMEEHKAHIPDHQALLLLAESLKHMAEEYDVFIISGTQLSEAIKTADFADETCLSSSKAIKNKLDLGCITTYPKPKELKQTEGFLEKRGFGNHLNVNRVTHVFKSRFNSTGYDKIKIFQHVDLSIGKTVDLFTTDEHNNLINIKKTIKFKGE